MGMRSLGMAALVAISMAPPVMADALEDGLIAQLEAQGYVSVTTRYTLLGRLQVLAQSPKGLREIVINPRTGEVLRDYLREDSRIVHADSEARTNDVAATAGGGIDLPDRPSVDVTSDGLGGSELVE